MRLFALAFSSTLLGGLSPALAQPSVDRGYPVQLWQPALGPQGFFTVDSARVPPHLSLSLSLSTSYARNPFSLYTIQGPARVETQVDVVRDLVSTELGFALGLLDQIQLGVALPFNVYQKGEDFTITGEPSGSNLKGASLGDLRVELKYQVASFGSEDNFAFAVVPGLTLPTGKDKNFAGDDNVTGRLRGVLEGRWDKVRAGATLGALLRGERTTFAATVGSQLLYGAAVEGKIHRDVALLGEVWGRSGLADFTEGYTDANPMEGDVGMRVALPKAFTMAVGAGLGLIRGIGAPKYRAFLAFGWAPNFDDRDNDGVFDYEDRCLDTPEDIDDYKDGDGCPEADNDGDAVLDAQDKCPNTAEDLDQYQDEDGCPEEDNDGDGVADLRDPCPNAKEDGRGKKPTDGCPST
ncbi:MAG TPA: thrombospondin type 3 repeat-containing protein, partial [Polyangia bacterium]